MTAAEITSQPVLSTGMGSCPIPSHIDMAAVSKSRICIQLGNLIFFEFMAVIIIPNRGADREGFLV